MLALMGLISLILAFWVQVLLPRSGLVKLSPVTVVGAAGFTAGLLEAEGQQPLLASNARGPTRVQ